MRSRFIHSPLLLIFCLMLIIASFLTGVNSVYGVPDCVNCDCKMVGAWWQPGDGGFSPVGMRTQAPSPVSITYAVANIQSTANTDPPNLVTATTKVDKYQYLSTQIPCNFQLKGYPLQEVSFTDSGVKIATDKFRTVCQNP